MFTGGKVTHSVNNIMTKQSNCYGSSNIPSKQKNIILFKCSVDVVAVTHTFKIKINAYQLLPLAAMFCTN